MWGHFISLKLDFRTTKVTRQLLTVFRQVSQTHSLVESMLLVRFKKLSLYIKLRKRNNYNILNITSVITHLVRHITRHVSMPKFLLCNTVLLILCLYLPKLILYKKICFTIHDFFKLYFIHCIISCSIHVG